MKKLFFLLLTITSVTYSCSNSNKSGTNNDEVISQKGSATDSIVEEPLVKESEPKDNWEYSEDTNEMDDTKSYFANILAEDQLYFDFPYQGGTAVGLLIRKKSSGTDVILRISQGQFMSNYNSNIKVRFDDDKPETYTFDEPSDNSSTVIFINNAKKFINRLKKSERLIIQCEFYNNGTQTIKFNTTGFVWDH